MNNVNKNLYSYYYVNLITIVLDYYFMNSETERISYAKRNPIPNLGVGSSNLAGHARIPRFFLNQYSVI